MNGFLNVLKPPGMSSGAVVARIKRLTGEKVGHAGTLDPEAAGVLPVMVGSAARLFDALQDKEKVYVAEAAFGAATDTQDAQGRVIQRGEAWQLPDRSRLEAALPALRGWIQQTPPLYSALKRGGQPLYKTARKGETVALEPRPVWIESLELLGQTARGGWLLRIACGKGTYIRTLCADLGRLVHCPAHMRFLLRERSGAFDLADAHPLEEITAASWRECLLPPDAPLGHLPFLQVQDRLLPLCLNGVLLRRDEWQGEYAPDTRVRVYAAGRFVGLYRVGPEGTLKADVIFNQR